ncbi:MAG TPA: hypothetical protein VFN19_04570 [Candidatus Nanopelagicales bacterium]|nr:hypothetical protein [Candidatus Nanopelagicales bacterium]
MPVWPAGFQASRLGAIVQITNAVGALVATQGEQVAYFGRTLGLDEVPGGEPCAGDGTRSYFGIESGASLG